MDKWVITKVQNGYVLTVVYENKVGKIDKPIEQTFVFHDKSKLLNHLAKSDLT